MPKTISGRSDDGALEKVPGLPGDYPQLVNDRARADRCGRQCGSTEDPRSGHIVPGAGAGSDEDSNLQVLCGSCNRTEGAAMEASA